MIALSQEVQFASESPAKRYLHHTGSWNEARAIASAKKVHKIGSTPFSDSFTKMGTLDLSCMKGMACLTIVSILEFVSETLSKSDDCLPFPSSDSVEEYAPLLDYLKSVYKRVFESVASGIKLFLSCFTDLDYMNIFAGKISTSERDFFNIFRKYCDEEVRSSLLSLRIAGILEHVLHSEHMLFEYPWFYVDVIERRLKGKLLSSLFQKFVFNERGFPIAQLSLTTSTSGIVRFARPPSDKNLIIQRAIALQESCPTFCSSLAVLFDQIHSISDKIDIDSFLKGPRLCSQMEPRMLVASRGRKNQQSRKSRSQESSGNRQYSSSSPSQTGTSSGSSSGSGSSDGNERDDQGDEKRPSKSAAKDRGMRNKSSRKSKKGSVKKSVPFPLIRTQHTSSKTQKKFYCRDVHTKPLVKGARFELKYSVCHKSSTPSFVHMLEARLANGESPSSDGLASGDEEEGDDYLGYPESEWPPLNITTSKAQVQATLSGEQPLSLPNPKPYPLATRVSPQVLELSYSEIVKSNGGDSPSGAPKTLLGVTQHRRENPQPPVRKKSVSSKGHSQPAEHLDRSSQTVISFQSKQRDGEGIQEPCPMSSEAMVIVPLKPQPPTANGRSIQVACLPALPAPEDMHLIKPSSQQCSSTGEHQKLEKAVLKHESLSHELIPQEEVLPVSEEVSNSSDLPNCLVMNNQEFRLVSVTIHVEKDSYTHDSNGRPLSPPPAEQLGLFPLPLSALPSNPHSEQYPLATVCIGSNAYFNTLVECPLPTLVLEDSAYVCLAPVRYERGYVDCAQYI